jgi:hypothetical protein
MKITILVFIFCCLFTFSLVAQTTYSIKGIIVDTASKAKLKNTSVSVLNAKDSILRKFTRADGNGLFSIDNLTRGKFILLVTYPGYADYVEKFTLDSAHTVQDFGKLNMILRAKLLHDVIIKGERAAIKIKGDTTEFDARAYKTQPNASVEDLLKQLQGIQVDKDGKITAQGQTVNKVLVDGEEFFGDDPTLVTKNLRADMVDKVQLYDKKSDQATFTGIDDGQKTKTLNIKLKEDKKNGYFGKADVGAGTDGYYQSQLLFNKFKAKQKFSIVSTISNDGKTGLGWQDSQKYGSSDNVQVTDDGGIYITSSGDDLDSWNGTYNGKGIPKAVNNGVHFDTKWDGDKKSLNTNYKMGILTLDGTDNIISQNNVAIGAINTSSNQKYHDYMFRNKLDLTYQVKLDTTSNLKLMADAATKHSETKSNYNSISRLNNDTILNTSVRDITNQVDTKIFDLSAFYTKKFKKKGRTFSWNVSEAYNESEANGYLKSEADYYTHGILSRSEIVDQYKTNRLVTSLLNSNMTYTEPLSKAVSVIINYGFGLDNSTADRKSFDKAPDGSYTLLNSLYSNNYKLNQLTDQAGAIFNYKKGKSILNFGAKVSDVNFQQVNEYTGDILKRSFVNWAPQANYSYKFSQQSSFNFNYNGKTTQPSIDQIQPVRVNTDPLNILIGNPNLTPSFANNFWLNYYSYKVLTSQFVSLYGNYSFTSNPIVQSTITNTTDSIGKRTTRYINLGNKQPYNYYAAIYFGRKLASTGIDVGFDLNVSGNKNYNISNSDLNIISSNTYSGRLQIRKYVPKKYDFNFSFGPSITKGGSVYEGPTILPNLNNDGHGYTGNGRFNVYLPLKFVIGSDAEYQYNSKTATFAQDYSKLLWNAWLEKAFDKDENFKIVLKCNDILNQNSGFERSSMGTLITQETYTTIKRYFMVSVVWNFNKMGGVTPKK